MTPALAPASVETLVAEELDALPRWLLAVLEPVPILVCDGGRRERAYGLYQGYGAARDHHADRIVIF